MKAKKKKNKNPKKRLFKMALAKVRENAKEAGFYDGRFKTRAVPDKKKYNRKKQPKINPSSL